MTEPSDDAEGRRPGHEPPPPHGAPGAGYAGPGYYGYPPPGYGFPPPGYGFRPPPPGWSPGGQPLASFGERLLAWLLDVAIVVVADIILVGPPFLLLFLNAPSDNEPAGPLAAGWVFAWLGIEAWAMVAGFGVTYVYFVELMWRSGQTVGKRVMNLRVVPLNPGESLSRGTAVKRWLIESVVAGVVGFLSLIDGLWQLWDKPFQQTLHDKVAQTVVVKVSP